MMAFLKLKAVLFYALLLAATTAVVEGQEDDSSSVQQLDCSFQGDPVKLDDNGDITLHHIANENDGTFIAEITYDGDGWVAFGKASDGQGQMVGGEVIIGLPEEVAGTSNPGKYALSAKNAAGVTLMDDDKQTLMDSTVTQNAGNNDGAGKTVLRYTKLLKEDNEHEIYVTEPNTFIWAYGSSNTFGYHSNNRGSVTLPFLKICRPVVTADDTADTDENDETTTDETNDEVGDGTTAEGGSATTTDGDEVEAPPAAASAASVSFLRFALLSPVTAMFYYVY